MISLHKKYGNHIKCKAASLLMVFICLRFIAIGQNINTPNKIGPLGTEVNTHTGNLFIPRNDVFVPARGFDISVSFYYNSYNQDENVGFGNGWNLGYGIRYKIDSISRIIIWGDGREDYYKGIAGGAFKTPAGFFDTLTQYQPNKYLLREPDGTKLYFDNSTHQKITRLQEPNGNFINFNYTDSLLTSLTNTAGQTISLNYNANGKLISLVDAIVAPSHTYTYTYDAGGNLAEVTDPLGGKNKYAYLVNGPMKAITDKNNNSVDIIYYPDFSTSELIGCNKRVSFSYDTSTNITVVTDHLATGNQVTNYHYQQVGTIAWVSSITGNCCGYNLNFEFDANGNKTKETDANGQVYNYTYDATGNMLTMNDPLNQTTTYTYSSDFNQVTSATDPKGNVYTMQYNTTGNLIKLTEPGNNIYLATYNTNGDIISSTDPKGNVYTYSYDAFGNPASVTGPNGYHAALVTDARGNLLSFTDARNNTTNAQYDILNRLKNITDPVSNAIQFSYDAEGNATSIINKNNETSLLNYDASNRLVQFTDPLNHKTEMSYDGMNNIIGVKNALGNGITYTYDTRNRLSSTKDALANTSQYDYDANGNLTSMTMPNGQTMNYIYDNINRVTSISDITGTIATIAYDKNNNVTAVTNGTGALTTATYDSLDRITKITDPLGFTNLFAYDKNDNIISITDMNGFTKNYVYDSSNRVKSYTDNNGFVIAVVYDAAGNIIQAKDQNNNITVYTYDSLNRVKTTTYPDGKYMQYGYDKKSNVISKRLTDGSTIIYQYDSANRIIAKTLPGGIIFTYGYDAINRIVSATNNNGTVAITYDALNRISSETYDGSTTSYNYNIAGRTQTTIYPDSTVITKNFDPRNRLTSIAKNNSTVVSYQYNNANQVTAKNFANGVSTNMQYDFANRLSSISTAGGSIQNTTFTYDNERNKTAINRLNTPSLSEQFVYDNGHRLTNYKRGPIGSPTIQNTYTYDAVGNRTTANLNGINTTYTHNIINQLTNSNNGSQNINFIYDNNGNLTYDGVFYKTYDVEGRLLKDSSSVSNVLTYKYDALGRRVQKNLNSSSYKYTYSGLAQIEERNGANNNLLNRTVFSNFLSPVLNEKTGTPYYYHQNEMNSVEAITNSSGNLTESYRYDAYGKPSIYDGSNNLITSSIAGNRIGFTGQEYDSATNSYRFHFRNYSPGTGTFNQRDPIGYADGMGMYQYVGNNPANGIDILGLEENPCNQSGNKNGKQKDDGYKDAKNWLDKANKAHKDYGKYLKDEFNKAIGSTLKLATDVISNTHDFAAEYTNINNNWKNNSEMQNYRAELNLGAKTTGLLAGLPAALNALGATGIAEGTVAAIFAPEAIAGAAMVASATGAYLAADKFAVKYTGKGLVEQEIITSPADNYARGQEQGIYDRDLKVQYDFLNSQGDEYKYMDGELRLVKKNNRAALYLDIRGRIDRGLTPRLHPILIPTTTTRPNCPQNTNTGGTQKKKPFQSFLDWLIEFLQSRDPNEIIGPDGVQPKHWVSVNDRLPYTILYENDKSASAPAKFVRITSPIEPKEDATSFQLGSFGFNNQTFAVPNSIASYYQRLDCRDSMGLYVDITAGYDQVSNQAFWEFQSIDPVTLLPPSDPLKGFLFLQDSAKGNAGHAFVNFNIKPKQTAITLDTIGARASIVFDGNDTIPTNIHTNTIDAFAPTSHINNLPSNSTNPITLSWTGTDDAGGSGIDYYTIYVSTDQVNYDVFIPKTRRNDTTLSLPPNSNYCFFVLATDKVGNKETLRLGEVQCIYVGVALPVTWLYFRGKTVAKDNILDWATANEQNSKQFDVERSLNGIDFSRIGMVTTAGNSGQTNIYQYTDHDIDRLNSEFMFYRLKQIDLNGNFKYSNIVSLRYIETKSNHTIVYPNPTPGSITILVADNTLVGTIAVVYDVNGRILENIKITASSQQVTLSKYVNGTYFIKMSNNELLKIVKQ